MPSTLQIISYNQIDLETWRTELPQIDQRTSFSNGVIEQQRQRLSPLRDNLKQINKSIKDAESELSSCQNMARYNGMYRSSYAYGLYLETPEDRELSRDISRIKDRVERLQVRQFEIKREMQPCINAKKIAENDVAQLSLRKQWLTQHIPAADLFLKRLKLDPAQLLIEFNTNLLKAISDYEEQHFFGLSLQVRMSLQLIKSQLAYLQDLSDPRAAQQSYLRVCGLLGRLNANVEAENKDAAFLRCLTTLLENAHIHPEGDLPDELHTGFNALVWYQNAFPNMPNEQSFLNDEAAAYERESAFLLHPNAVHPTELKTRIAYAAYLINSEIKNTIRDNKPVDYHFYTNAVRNLYAVYHNPGNQIATKRLGDLAEYAVGAPSVNKKIAGALLVVLGALIIAASMTALILSAGASSPFTAWGMALGLGAIQAKSVLGIGIGVGMASGYGLSFWGGAAFASGMRHGLSKELLNIKKEAAEHEELPPPAYSPEWSGHAC